MQFTSPFSSSVPRSCANNATLAIHTVRTNGHLIDPTTVWIGVGQNRQSQMLGAVSNAENLHQMLDLVWTLHFAVLLHLPGAHFLNQSFFRGAVCESPLPTHVKVTHLRALYTSLYVHQKYPHSGTGGEGWLDWWFPSPAQRCVTRLIYICQSACSSCEICTGKHLGTANRSQRRHHWLQPHSSTKCYRKDNSHRRNRRPTVLSRSLKKLNDHGWAWWPPTGQSSKLCLPHLI